MHEQHNVLEGRSRQSLGTSRGSQHHFKKTELTSPSLFLPISFLDQSSGVKMNLVILNSVIFYWFLKGRGKGRSPLCRFHHSGEYWVIEALFVYLIYFIRIIDFSTCFIFFEKWSYAFYCLHFLQIKLLFYFWDRISTFLPSLFFLQISPPLYPFPTLL